MMHFLGSTGLEPGLALVFDMDGVIVDSNPVHSVCWREYLRQYGIDVPADFDRNMFGKRNDEIVHAIFGEGLSPSAVARHGADKEALYRQMMSARLKQQLVRGLGEFLERHQEAPMGVASNAEPANIDFVLDGGNLRRFFRVVVNGAQVSRPKPDPEVYVKAAGLLGIAPHNCIVFEDSYAGVAAAKAAGARVVALQTTHEEFQDVDLTIRDFLDAELEPWLSSQRARH